MNLDEWAHTPIQGRLCTAFRRGSIYCVARRITSAEVTNTSSYPTSSDGRLRHWGSWVTVDVTFFWMTEHQQIMNDIKVLMYTIYFIMSVVTIETEFVFTCDISG